ncbi:hypothetical protein CABS01_11730 [Colletotrichum abscissum]|uniref:Uncharacterized protein n=1 Tax=Colletotrichum abscissum TaxID=1671311 RepID=A0A9P9XCW6_9PEZI|nr:uncharacterized protein CABS01_11730 [Colletotrichum abscissum]KAI3548687.1 hypothetical protein CABS02_08217 [Colletotrichum abscissum]KAK1492833.1 hypothetical protein CABS01_11730 [Colletotrichum abscissum]
MDFGLAKTNELVTFVGGSGGDGGEDEEPWMNDWEAGQGKLRSWYNRTFADWIGCVSDDDGAVDMGQIDKPGVSCGSDPASLEFQKEYRDVAEGSQRATNSSTTGSAPPPKDNIDGD